MDSTPRQADQAGKGFVMRPPLAWRLLSSVIDWSPDALGDVHRQLQVMAAYKYDEYQQFSPGLRFVESLARWLRQFESSEERRILFEHVWTKLTFCSSAEMHKLVSLSYQDYVRPLLLRQAAEEAGLAVWNLARVAETTTFKRLRRQTLFVGLTDGARIDVFRRMNNEELRQEQIMSNYNSLGNRQQVRQYADLLSRVISKFYPDEDVEIETYFRVLVLIDDFAGSGASLLRRAPSGQYAGRIADIYREIVEPGGEARTLTSASDLRIYLLLYMATAQARTYLEYHLNELWASSGVTTRVLVVQTIEEGPLGSSANHEKYSSILRKYYERMDPQGRERLGDLSAKYGIMSGGPPLVIHHNTPNNSLFLLWLSTPRFNALFPRVGRGRPMQ